MSTVLCNFLSRPKVTIVCRGASSGDLVDDENTTGTV